MSLTAADKAAVAEIVAATLAQHQSVSTQVKTQVIDRKTLQHPSDPASRRMRRMISALSGVYPADSTGFKGFTKADAGKAIDALQAGKPFKYGRKTLKPAK